MADDNWEYLAYAKAQARHAAYLLVNKSLFTSCEKEDLVQELLLECWRRWPQFDQTRSGAKTYISTIMRHAASDLCRRELTAKRYVTRCSRSLDACEDGQPSVSADALCDVAAPDSELQMDVQHVVDELTEADQRLAAAIVETGSVSGAAKLLGISPGSAFHGVAKLRKAFEAKGLAGYLRSCRPRR